MDEYSLWLRTNVSSARQDQVRAFADDLGDLLALRQADIEASPALDLASWPEAARIRFVRAWRELKFPDGYSSDSSSCSEESVGTTIRHRRPHDPRSAGRRSASANAPSARHASSGHAPARTQETSAAVGRRPSAGEEALLWRSERRDARGRRVAVPGGDTSTTVV